MYLPEGEVAPSETSVCLLKETCGRLPQSSNECICQRERLLQVKQAFVYW